MSETNEDVMAPPNTSIGKWVIGLVLALVTLSVPTLASMAWRNIDSRLARQEEDVSDNKKRITALEVSFAALQAANLEKNQRILEGLEQLRADLRDHRRESSRR